MTDLRKLLIEARAWIVANEKHESVCPTRVMGTWGRCRCGFVSIIGRIDGALAEKVEPVALPCCGYYDASAIKWNDFNKVVQCHNCGHAYSAAPASQWRRVEDWQPIETAPKGKTVLVHYKNQLGNGRTMRGCYYPPETLESDTEESGWADEGWYEQSEAYEYLMPLDGDPTHWMPLPALPEDK